MHRVHLLVGKCVFLGNESYVGVYTLTLKRLPHPHPTPTTPIS